MALVLPCPIAAFRVKPMRNGSLRLAYHSLVGRKPPAYPFSPTPVGAPRPNIAP